MGEWGRRIDHSAGRLLGGLGLGLDLGFDEQMSSAALDVACLFPASSLLPVSSSDDIDD